MYLPLIINCAEYSKCPKFGKLCVKIHISALLMDLVAALCYTARMHLFAGTGLDENKASVMLQAH